MSVFGIKMKKRRATSQGSYHNVVEQSHSFHRRSTKKESIGIGRAIFSGLSLSLGGLMCYVSLHYLPAFVQTQKILGSNAIDTSTARLQNKGPIRKVLGPYIDAFSMQRTYLRPGQEIEAQFILPEGATLDLEIEQCRRVIAIEIFKCDVISRKNVSVTKATLGDKSFQFANGGFYHFSHKVTLANGSSNDYTVVWTRL